MLILENALDNLTQINDLTERAIQLAGFLSTSFKEQGVELIMTGQLAYHSYVETPLLDSELELAAFAGRLTPRLLQDIMGRKLKAEGSLTRWTLVGVPVRFHFESGLALRNLCRDFHTDYGVVKLWPAEEITAERILAAVFPSPNPEAEKHALALLTGALIDAFDMDWITLRDLCHQPHFRVGEELIQMRLQAKRNADALGLTPDPVGDARFGANPSVSPWVSSPEEGLAAF